MEQPQGLHRAGSWVPLIDVSEISMADIVASQNTILGRCVDRLIASLNDPDGIISAFQSFVD
jgi:FXSXX-COOH protein